MISSAPDTARLSKGKGDGPRFKDQFRAGRQAQKRSTASNSDNAGTLPIVQAIQVNNEERESNNERNTVTSSTEGVLCVVTRTKLLFVILILFTAGMVIGGFCIFGKCSGEQESVPSIRSPTDEEPSSQLRPSMSPSTPSAAAPGSICNRNEECSTGRCERSGASPLEDTKQCCEFNEDVFITEIGANLCSRSAPEGSSCFDNQNSLCQSGVCVGQVCQSSLQSAEALCDDDGDCILGSCALQSAQWPSQNVCCSSGQSVVLPNATVCTEQPVGALCAFSNEACASGVCLDTKCVESGKIAGQACSGNAECQGTCVNSLCTNGSVSPGEPCDDHDDCASDCAFESRTELTQVCCDKGSEFVPGIGGSVGGSVCCPASTIFLSGECCPFEYVRGSNCVPLVAPFSLDP